MRKLFGFLFFSAASLLVAPALADDCAEIGPPPPPRVQLHVRSAAPGTRAKLYLRVDQADEHVCEAPCDPVVPAGAELVARTDDDGVARRGIQLRYEGGRELDVVIARNHENAAYGWIAIAAGVGCGIAGGYLLATANSASRRPSSEGPYAGMGTALLHLVGGGALVVTGVVLPIAGLVSIATPSKPNVAIEPTRTLSADRAAR